MNQRRMRKINPRPPPSGAEAPAVSRTPVSGRVDRIDADGKITRYRQGGTSGQGFKTAFQRYRGRKMECCFASLT